MKTKELATNGRQTTLPVSDETPKSEIIQIKPFREKTIEFSIIGTAPYMQNHFSASKAQQMMETQMAGSQAKSKKVRKARDFDKDFREATYRTKKGQFGMPAAAFRNAAISACKTVGFHMTKAKLTIFCEADGFDEFDGTPLVFISGTPEKDIRPARNDNGSCDLRARPVWKEGWRAKVRIRFDEDQFSLADVANLMTRVGKQVGIGEGRADSKDSAGIGFGFFEVEEMTELVRKAAK